MFEVALRSLRTLRSPTPQPPPKYMQPGRQVSVRVREVDAAPRCACRPRTAGSVFERLGLERARSRDARRPHRAARVDVHHPATALQGAGQLDAHPLPRASDIIDSSTPARRPGTRDAASAPKNAELRWILRVFARRVEMFNGRIACLDRSFFPIKLYVQT